VIIDLVLERKTKRSPLRFAYSKMVNAGYTGRNHAEVRKHIEELARKGIPGPPTTPTLYPVIGRALVKDPVIEVYSRETCGEVEYVLLIENENRIYVGVGSDHTDRKLEAWDIARAKQICPNIIGATVWALEDVAGHWDELVLRCRQVLDGKEVPYQEGTLSRLMAPKDLMAFVHSKTGGPLDGTIIFSGTMAALTGGFVYGSRLSAELLDPKLNRRLVMEYDVQPLDGFH
jgi:Protein of unknown function (DUF2848)